MRPRNQTPSAAEFGQMRAYLASKLGLTPAQLNAAVGPNPGGRSRGQIAQALAGWLKQQPKGP